MMSSRFLKLLIFAIRYHKLTCNANNATVLLQIIWAPCNNINNLQQSETQLLYFGHGIAVQQVADTHSACNPAVQRTPASNLDILNRRGDSK